MSRMVEMSTYIGDAYNGFRYYLQEWPDLTSFQDYSQLEISIALHASADVASQGGVVFVYEGGTDDPGDDSPSVPGNILHQFTLLDGSARALYSYTVTIYNPGTDVHPFRIALQGGDPGGGTPKRVRIYNAALTIRGVV